MTRAVRTRNAGTWTEAAYWGRVRSHLRRLFRFNWLPAKQALEAAKRPYRGPNKRQKVEYQCAVCKEWFPRDGVEIDHVVPCGSLKSEADLAGFLTRLYPEDPAAYQVLCESCHLRKTAAEREARAAA
jgi:5-methylcytosine-specific restriction endonuclease McrA